MFLSASYPPRDGNAKYEPIDPGEITYAVLHFTAMLLESNGTLTMAAHPMITPMLTYGSKILGVKNAVTVYRSEWYESNWIPRINELENDELGKVIRTKKAENEEKSLNIMRRAIIQDTCYAGPFSSEARKMSKPNMACLQSAIRTHLEFRLAGPAARQLVSQKETAKLSDWLTLNKHVHICFWLIVLLKR